MKEEIKSARLVIQSERGARLWTALMGILLFIPIFLIETTFALVVAPFFLLFALVGDVKRAGEVLDELPFATKLK